MAANVSHIPLSKYCPCCKGGPEHAQDFQKIVDLQDAGLAIYRHICKIPGLQNEKGLLDKTVKMAKEVFILQNTNDVKISFSDILSELEKKKITCANCLKIVERALKLLSNEPNINKKEVRSVCDRCAAQHRYCDHCENILKKFTTDKLVECDKRRTRDWLCKMKHILDEENAGSSYKITPTPLIAKPCIKSSYSEDSYITKFPVICCGRPSTPLFPERPVLSENTKNAILGIDKEIGKQTPTTMPKPNTIRFRCNKESTSSDDDVERPLNERASRAKPLKDVHSDEDDLNKKRRIDEKAPKAQTRDTNKQKDRKKLDQDKELLKEVKKKKYQSTKLGKGDKDKDERKKIQPKSKTDEDKVDKKDKQKDNVNLDKDKKSVKNSKTVQQKDSKKSDKDKALDKDDKRRESPDKGDDKKDIESKSKTDEDKVDEKDKKSAKDSKTEQQKDSKKSDKDKTLDKELLEEGKTQKDQITKSGKGDKHKESLDKDGKKVKEPKSNIKKGTDKQADIMNLLKDRKAGKKQRDQSIKLGNGDKKWRGDHRRKRRKIGVDVKSEESIYECKKEYERSSDMIIGSKICKRTALQNIDETAVSPFISKSTYTEKQYSPPNADDGETEHTIDGSKKGTLCYALSDRTFIEKGWTVLPTEKVVRKTNIYRMRPSRPEFDWFKHNKKKQFMRYDTGEKLADFDENGRGRWYYKNGCVALVYYDAEETNARQRYIVYSSGEPDDYGQAQPHTILGVFDYVGNGIVYDHTGKIRLKYNQSEGILLDPNVGPESHWKWHTLNDPSVIEQVIIDTQMRYKDTEILKLGSRVDEKPEREIHEDMLAIEFENLLKEKNMKMNQTFKPFLIRMKALKINKYFSLRVLDQATIYINYRDGATSLKLNIGMILDQTEIIDTDVAELGIVYSGVEKYPAQTESIAYIHKTLHHAQHIEKMKIEHDRNYKFPVEILSVEKLTAAASRPMRPPLTLPSCATNS